MTAQEDTLNSSLTAKEKEMREIAKLIQIANDVTENLFDKTANLKKKEEEQPEEEQQETPVSYRT